MTDLDAATDVNLMELISWMVGLCPGCVLRHGCTCLTLPTAPAARAAAWRVRSTLMQRHLAQVMARPGARHRGMLDLRCQGISLQSAPKFEGAVTRLGGR